MIKTLYVVILTTLISSCCCRQNDIIKDSNYNDSTFIYEELDTSGMTIRTRYNPPEGYTRIETDDYGNYIRDSLKLKPYFERVHLYDGRYKYIEYVDSNIYHIPYTGILDIKCTLSTLQCADMCIKIRSDVLFALGYYHDIQYHMYIKSGVNLIPLSCKFFNNKENYLLMKQNKWYDSYLAMIYNYANTRTLDYFDTEKIDTIINVSVGDIIINSNLPGHAVTILDVAKNDSSIALLLCQSYIPAQEAEILRGNSKDHCWFIINKDTYNIDIGCWNFSIFEIKKWKNHGGRKRIS